MGIINNTNPTPMFEYKHKWVYQDTQYYAIKILNIDVCETYITPKILEHLQTTVYHIKNDKCYIVNYVRKKSPHRLTVFCTDIYSYDSLFFDMNNCCIVMNCKEVIDFYNLYTHNTNNDKQILYNVLYDEYQYQIQYNTQKYIKTLKKYKIYNNKLFKID